MEKGQSSSESCSIEDDSLLADEEERSDEADR